MMPRNILIVAFAIAVVFAIGACSNSAGEPSPTAVPVIQMPTVDSADQTIQSHLATKVLEVGNQRVAFLLNTQKALIDAPQVQISVAHAGTVEPIAQVTADYNPWPYGVRGSYAAPVEFPAAGKYQLTAEPIGGEVSGQATIDIEVLPESPVPSLGDTTPKSQTKTLGDGTAVFDLTTDFEPDEDLYQLSVADAIASPEPTVIVFATPAFCTSPTCGPQVDTVSELRAAHPEKANYIHVELYDNPEEIQGDLSRARLVPAADEWGFTQIPGWTNESWVFVLASEGIVHQRFEGYATLTELEEALSEVSRGE